MVDYGHGSTNKALEWISHSKLKDILIFSYNTTDAIKNGRVKLRILMLRDRRRKIFVILGYLSMLSLLSLSLISHTGTNPYLLSWVKPEQQEGECLLLDSV